MVNKSLSSLLFCLSFVFLSHTAIGQDADFSVTATNLNEDQVPLGWIPFTPTPSTPAHIPVSVGQVISNDLAFGGRAKMFLVQSEDSLTRQELLEKGAMAYVTGTYQRYRKSNTNKVQYILRCYLRDSETKELIYGKKYIASPNQLRLAAHQFADEVIYQLFGEVGIAQTKIVFTSRNRNGNRSKEVYIMDYDGENVIQVTKNRSLNIFPCWLKDNKEILYTSYKQGKPQLFRHNIKTGVAKIFIQSSFLNMGPEYNSVDQEIVFTSSVRGNTEIFRKIIPENSNNTNERSQRARRLTFSSSLESSPSWSPNGYEIAFTSGRSGEPHIYVMDRNGSNTRRLTYEGNYNTSPTWSPKGNKIAFVRMEGAEMNIWTISPTGGDPVRLTSGMGKNESPSWSPDGRAIIFSSDRSGSVELYSMWADGSHPRQLTNTGENSAPQWSHY